MKSDDERRKIYTNNRLSWIEEQIHKFIKNYYITTIEKLVFNLAHVQILGRINFRKTRKDAMKSRHKHGDIRVVKYYDH